MKISLINHCFQHILVCAILSLDAIVVEPNNGFSAHFARMMPLLLLLVVVAAVVSRAILFRSQKSIITTKFRKNSIIFPFLRLSVRIHSGAAC